MKSLKSMLVLVAICLPLAAASAAATAGTPATKDILTVAAESGKFKTLLKMVEAAGLSGKLKGEGPYTLFAPTDEAFAKFDQAVLEDLMQPQNKDELITVVKSHIVAGRHLSADLAGKTGKLQTVAETRMTINTRNGVMADNARVTSSDVLASNGVIHVVDEVIESEF